MLPAINGKGAIGVAAQNPFALSTFYDPQNNNLNIPCEGPKIIRFDFSTDDLIGQGSGVADYYNLDFTSVVQSGTFTSVQTLYLDFTDYLDPNVPLIVQMIANGTNQRFLVSNVNTGNTGSGYGNTIAGIFLPISVSAPPQLQLLVSQTGTDPVAGSVLRATFYNHIVYPAQVNGLSPT